MVRRRPSGKVFSLGFERGFRPIPCYAGNRTVVTKSSRSPEGSPMKFGSPLILVFCLAGPVVAGEPFAIEVVDSRTGRGVPLAELRTVNDIKLVTDSRGIAAFDEPGLMGRKVFFHISSHGYEVPKDGFGFRGKTLDVVAGGRGRIAIDRVNIAERLYRVTGAGIYRDSVLVGDMAPIRQPVLNAGVLGSDSVLTAVFQGKVHWFWGDTNRSGYPLGNFHSPTATSRLPGDGGLDIEVGVDLDYAVDAEGFAAPSAKMPGDGPTWIDGLIALKDASGTERMFAAYAKIKPPLETYERGLAEFDPRTRRFAKVASIPLEAPAFPIGHPFVYKGEGGEHIYYCDPYPLVRVRADVDDLAHPERFEAYTCLLPGSTVDRPQIDKAPDGTPRYAWRRGAKALDAQGQRKLVQRGLIRERDALLHLQDVDTGRRVVGHKGSTYWNAARGRWVMIAVEVGGESSHLGEVWFAEADTPLGPWVFARKVVTHNKYSFYSPKQHPMFAKQDGRVIFFEGTYSVTFSGNTNPTPRYDYNQVLYKLDLDDARLNLPVPIYVVDGQLVPRSPGHPIAFFAYDRPAPGSIPIGDPPLFHAMPVGQESSRIATLYERTGKDFSAFYIPDENNPAPASAKPIARVWRSPMLLVLPPG
jgi:hypothetical protein